MANHIQNPNNKPEPYSFSKAILIIIALALFDTVSYIVLVVGAYIFTKKGHTGIGMALAITNIIAPDAMPVVDEIFGSAVVVIPYIKSHEQGKSVGKSIQAGVDSVRQYKQTSNDYIQKSEQVASKIGVLRNQYTEIIIIEVKKIGELKNPPCFFIQLRCSCRKPFLW